MRCACFRFNILLMIIASTGAFCQVRLPRLIRNGMVLQRDAPIKVWGWSSENEPIELAFRETVYRTSADSTGNWEITIPSQSPGGPFVMVIRGKSEITISDVLIGDVWICSGQSNMELTMERVKEKYAAVIASGGNLNIRQFVVPDQYDFKGPQSDLEDGRWDALTPETIMGFAAVPFFLPGNSTAGITFLSVWLTLRWADHLWRHG